MVKIFMGGFPLDMQEMELVQMVSPYANVETIKIVRDKKTKICKGYAFLEISDLEGAERAVESLNGVDMRDRTLSLNIVDPTSAGTKPAPLNKSRKADYGKTSTFPDAPVKMKRRRL
jgi:RNA recognition motif-containing protein